MSKKWLGRIVKVYDYYGMEAIYEGIGDIRLDSASKFLLLYKAGKDEGVCVGLRYDAIHHFEACDVID